MKTRYISKDTATLYARDKPAEKFIELLWGDTVRILDENPSGDKYFVAARGCEGWVKAEHLMDTSLLELYFIDVGQGDSVLIVTPEEQRRHILIDGGYPRVNQNHQKSAADFVDWKFNREYGMKHIHLDVMMASHNDADHYGGLWDLVNPAAKADLCLKTTQVDQFYHAGVSW